MLLAACEVETKNGSQQPSFSGEEQFEQILDLGPNSRIEPEGDEAEDDGQEEDEEGGDSYE